MEKISCEICGGEICRAEGKYRCVNCGCLYCAEDLREMLKKKNAAPPEAAEEPTPPPQSEADSAPAKEENSPSPSTAAHKGRGWMIAAIVLVIFLIALAQVWLNIRSGTENASETEVRSVQEIIDSALATSQTQTD